MNLDRNIKQSLNYCLKKDGPFGWSKILGFTKKELKDELSSKFQEDMTFENYGTVWGVTFIIPRRIYNINKITDPDFKKCWSLKNLKPDYLINCYRQKKKISKSEINKYALWDILPECCDLAKYIYD